MKSRHTSLEHIPGMKYAPQSQLIRPLISVHLILGRGGVQYLYDSITGLGCSKTGGRDLDPNRPKSFFEVDPQKDHRFLETPI